MTKAKREILKLSRQLNHYATEYMILTEKCWLAGKEQRPTHQKPDYYLGQSHAMRYAAEVTKSIADEMQ